MSQKFTHVIFYDLLILILFVTWLILNCFVKMNVFTESLEALERGEMKYSGLWSDTEAEDEGDVDVDPDLDPDLEIDPEVKETDDDTLVEQVIYQSILIYLSKF